MEDDDEIDKSIREVSLTDFFPLEIEGDEEDSTLKEDSNTLSSLCSSSTPGEGEDEEEEDTALASIQATLEALRGRVDVAQAQFLVYAKRRQKDKHEVRRLAALVADKRRTTRALRAKLPVPNTNVRTTRDLARMFIGEHTKELREIFKVAHRYPKGEILECDVHPVSKRYTIKHIRNEYKFPRGIIGSASRFGKQAFMVYFRGSQISGPMLDLEAGTTTFEDPRDCATVIHQIEKLFKAYCSKKV